MRLYAYVGPKRIAERVRTDAAGFVVRTAEDFRRWVEETEQETLNGSVIATYIVDESGELRVADRRSEHVACAGGRPVRAAGELTIAVGTGLPEVVAVSNQSTGYCPEPECWSAVADVLGRIGSGTPGGFTPTCVFRRCESCDNVNVVKDGVFECAVCGSELPAEYNVQPR